MNDCIFCKIAAGQIKAQVVYEDPDVMAFRDVNPQAPVHILIIPKKHVPRISALTDGAADLLHSVHRALLELVKTEKSSRDGFRFLANEGKNGGQTVEHLHFHFLAGRPLGWPPG